MSATMSLPANCPTTDPARAASTQRTKLNWLRAAVLGANDGVVSIAGLVIGVASATTDRPAIMIAGVAGLFAGALSMAAGEFISVSTQRDSERATLDRTSRTLKDDPQRALEDLTAAYEAKGLDRDLASQVARKLTSKDPLGAHAEAMGLDPEALTNPWQAAWASMAAFTVGALLPLLTILVLGPSLRIPLTFAAVVVALGATGAVSANLGDSPVRPAVVRVVMGGALAMAITFAVGRLFGAAA